MTADDDSAQWVIVRDVRCRRCAYDLRGLDANGRCPECGLEIWPSVMHLVDPAASKLPRLRDPVGVGNALFWLIACNLVAAASLASMGLVRWTVGLPRTGTQVLGLTLPLDLPLVAALATLASIWSVYKFMPPRGEAADVAVRRQLWTLAAALVVWTLLSLVLWEREHTWARLGLMPDSSNVVFIRSLVHLTIALAAASGLTCLGSIFQTIGQRSREYRRAQGGRQGAQPMRAAAIALATGSIFRALGSQVDALEVAWTLGTIIVAVSTFMLIIGLAYLLMNAWWIRRSLRKPPPRLEDLLRQISQPRS